jgi:Cu(I)/Ag(I) efflux system membrane protein CusA/SilA
VDLDRHRGIDVPELLGNYLEGSPGADCPDRVAGSSVLEQVARLDFAPGAAMIRSENGQLNDLVSIDVRGRDVGGYVADAKRLVAERVALPPGYRLEWSGQYESLKRVKARMQIVVPLTIAVILLLLYLTFGSLAKSAIVMLSLPFALIGGVWAVWLLDYNLSVAVAVGFIALAGVAAETGVVMVLYLDQAWAHAVRGGRSPTLADLVQAIEAGAVNRLRPKLMTVAAIMLGLLPALWATGTGAEVMQRIAAPMVGGMVSSTVLTLVVIPVWYFLWRRRELGRRTVRSEPPTPAGSR